MAFGHQGVALTGRSFVGFPALTITATNLLSLDFKTGQPSSSFPETSAEMTGLGLTAPDEIWLCDETSGSLTGEIAANTLTAIGSDEQQGKFMIGISKSGLDYVTNKLGVETGPTAGDGFEAANTTLYDPGSSSLAFFGVFRSLQNPSDTSARIRCAHKGTSSSYYEITQLSSGTLRATFSDGVTTVDVDVSGNHIDGAWHAYLVILDVTGGNAYLVTDHGSSSASLGALGSITNASRFAICQSANDGRGQICYHASWVGANAEGLVASRQAHFDALWTHGKDPTGEMNNTFRAGILSFQQGSVDGELRYGVITDDEVPIGYSPRLSHVSKLAGWMAFDITNLCTDSDSFFQTWTFSNATSSRAIADVIDTPEGWRVAEKLTASANNGYAQIDYTSVASQIYPHSVWIKRAGASNVTGRLSVFDGVTELAATTFTATGKWQEVFVTATSSSTTTSLRIEIDTSGEAIYLWRTCISDSNREFCLPIYTNGSTVTSGRTRFFDTHAAGLHMKGGKGEIVHRALFYEPSASEGRNRHFFQFSTSFLFQNGRRGRQLGSGLLEYEFGDDSITTFSTITTTGFSPNLARDELRMRMQWDDASITSGVYTRLIISQVDKADQTFNGAASTFTGTDTENRYELGSTTLGQHMFGWIAEYDVYDGVNP